MDFRYIEPVCVWFQSDESHRNETKRRRKTCHIINATKDTAADREENGNHCHRKVFSVSSIRTVQGIYRWLKWAESLNDLNRYNRARELNNNKNWNFISLVFSFLVWSFLTGMKINKRIEREEIDSNHIKQVTSHRIVSVFIVILLLNSFFMCWLWQIKMSIFICLCQLILNLPSSSHIYEDINANFRTYVDNRSANIMHTSNGWNARWTKNIWTNAVFTISNEFILYSVRALPSMFTIFVCVFLCFEDFIRTVSMGEKTRHIAKHCCSSDDAIKCLPSHHLRCVVYS